MIRVLNRKVVRKNLGLILNFFGFGEMGIRFLGMENS
jgi:hypothetical protein